MARQWIYQFQVIGVNIVLAQYVFCSMIIGKDILIVHATPDISHSLSQIISHVYVLSFMQIQNAVLPLAKSGPFSILLPRIFSSS